MSDRRAYALLALRLSLGLLMLVWGSDKLVNPDHGVQVAETFYFGILSARAVMPVLGVLEVILGLVVMAGVARRYAYPILAAVTGVTLIGVWRSIVDPWGWMIEGGNALFFPSIIIFSAVLVLMAVGDDDQLVLGRRKPVTVTRS
jgi:uncharacterized membrane protein YphA (DoxX/SURF4 family)